MNTPVWKGVQMNNEREHEMNTDTKTLLNNVLLRHRVNEPQNNSANLAKSLREHAAFKKAEQSIGNRLNIRLVAEIRRLADLLVRLEGEVNIQIPRDLEARFDTAGTEDELWTVAHTIKAALLGGA